MSGVYFMSIFVITNKLEGMMYYRYSDEELRTICRNHIENFEKWARIFIHNVLSEKIGDNYFHEKGADGNYRMKKAIVEKADKMMADEPLRFPTPLDTLFVEDIIYILCKPDFYRDYFSPYLHDMYPEGNNELRTFLERLIPIRNKLSHTNPFSIREAERCVCYSNDFIDCIKEYYRMAGKDKDFNIPTIIKVNDSLGNEYIIKDGRAGESLTIIDPATKQKKVFYLGDKFSLNLTLDPSFSEDSYNLIWQQKEGIEILDNGKRINVTITNQLIGESAFAMCKLVTKNEWHRFGGYDQQLFVNFKALPH